ncbi:hypothetical protein [Colwellia hornerae]|uniref:Porin family protein n=1 Tax=Colwellia hornerae TaxID=89402 RepID=A0A5C6QG79_9GAMM|nr:hypothetical protein [Colwellia hornerae]TWX52301.1 hypothetical protein ESZ28_12945 [Colwellia hornerae]TWX57860.1 hypothetical protein ESZ26_12910 [Colwellia hornerae]TWX67562.1 hypothetical protein ESZ27_08780 [Colwellia hornerae]
MKINIDNNEQENLTLQKSQLEKNIMIKNLYKLRKTFAVSGIFIASSLFSNSINALELAGNIHKGQDAKSQGYSFSLADNFTKGGNLYWTFSYNNLEKVKYDLPFTVSGERFFKINTIDGLVSYRHKIQSYNVFFKKLTIEYQLGASLALTENKLIYTDPNSLDTVEIYPSQENDINMVLGVVAHYKLNKNTALNLGVKYQPNFSEFGAIASVYLGLSYRFGRGLDY